LIIKKKIIAFRSEKVLAVIGILLNSRSQKSSSFQKTIGIALYYSQCPKKTFLILHRLGVCCSYETIVKIVREGSNFAIEKFQQWVEEHKVIDLVVDNIDFSFKVSFFFLFFEKKKIVNNQ